MGGGKEILIKQAKVFRRRVVKGGGGFFAFFLSIQEKGKEKGRFGGGEGE